MTHYLEAAPNSGCLRILITTPPLPQTRLTCYVGLAIIVAKRCITLEQGCFKLASTGVGIKWTGRRISWRLMWSSWILPLQKTYWTYICIFWSLNWSGGGYWPPFKWKWSKKLFNCSKTPKNIPEQAIPQKKKSVSSGAISLGSPVMAETTQSWDQPHCVGLKTLKNYYNV